MLIPKRKCCLIQGVKRLFVLAYDNAASNNQVYVDSFKK